MKIGEYFYAIPSDTLIGNACYIVPKWYFDLHGRIPDTKSRLKSEMLDEISDHLFVAKLGMPTSILLEKMGMEINRTPNWHYLRPHNT